MSAHRQALRIRNLYFKAVLSQEMAWHDARKSGEISSRIGRQVTFILQTHGLVTHKRFKKQWAKK